MRRDVVTRDTHDATTWPPGHSFSYPTAYTPETLSERVNAGVRTIARGPVARPIRLLSRPRARYAQDGARYAQDGARYARLTTHSQRDTPHRSQRYKHFCRAPGPGTRGHFRQHAVACTAPEPYPCPRVHSSRISGLSLHQRVQDSSARISGLSLRQRESEIRQSASGDAGPL